MKLGICSGYFQRFHTGHRKYIKDAIAACDMVVVIVNNDRQQKRKYKGFKKLKSAGEIAEQIRKELEVMTTESIDQDGSVCQTLTQLRKKYPGDDLYFCKDADRTIENIPEAKTLARENIKLLQFSNPKVESSTAIMQREAK